MISGASTPTPLADRNRLGHRNLMRLPSLSLTLFAMLTVGCAASKPGTISGRVVLIGTPPPARPIEAVMKDPNARRFHVTAPLTRTFVVSRDGGLADVFVRIKSGLEGRTFTVPGDRPLIETSGTFFHPEVTGVMAGQPFRIRSADPMQHNVAATPKANAGFNVAVANQGQVTVKSFAAPELFVKLACHVHPWELCYLCVEAHPFFSVTGADGRFVLPAGLPAGTYEVEAVHRKGGSMTQTVQFDGKTALDLRFQLQAP